MALFAELRRRNVFKVAILYVIGGWLVYQIAAGSTRFLDAPAWVPTVAGLLLLLGLPVALIFAWAYEITPGGLKRAVDVDQTQSIVYKTGQKLNAALAVLLVLLAVGFVVGRLIPDTALPLVDRSPPTPALVVMPFAGDAEAWLTDGLAMVLSRRLAAVPGITVTAMPSARIAATLDADRAAMGEQLGVAQVVSGTVQRDAGELRVHLRMVEAASGDAHLDDTLSAPSAAWAGIVDDMVAAILDALEIESPVPAGTDVPQAAFDAWLQAAAFGFAADRDGLRQQAALAKEATSIAPELGAAWLYYGYARYALAHRYGGHGKEAFADARRALLRAAALGESRAYALLALVQIEEDRNVQKAADTMQVADELAGRDWLVRYQLAEFCQLVGAPGAALNHVGRLREVDPLGSRHLDVELRARIAAGRFEDAAASLAALRAAGITPDPWLAGALALAVGDPQLALSEFSAASTPAVRDAGAARAFDRLQRRDDADAALRNLLAGEPLSNELEVASVYANRDEAELAFDWLAQAVATGGPALLELRRRASIDFAPLVADPRWSETLRAAGLDDSQFIAPVCDVYHR